VIAHGLTPILNVTDLHASIAWFELLGWRKLWTYDDPDPSFGAVGSGACEIFLCPGGQGGRGESGVWMSVWVDDVDEVHRTCLAHGLDVAYPPTDEPWGVREMHVRHPDGHILRISRGQQHDHPHPHEPGHGHGHGH
jgi:catechol 2,3-dioxygenase-like lactoylglutathione lyase family enzyme